MATTYDWTGKAHVPSKTSGGQTVQLGENEMVVQSVYIDASTYNMGASDVYQVFKVAAGFTPIRFVVNVATAEGDAATLDIGDGSSTARYETDANLNSAAVTGTMDAYHVYTAADTIDIIPSAALDAAKFTVTMIGCYSKLA